MAQTLKIVQGIYEAMEQGNIGKVLNVIDKSFIIHLSKSLGGNYYGREGMLEVVSKMCSSSSKIKKITENFIEFDNQIIVVGTILFTNGNSSLLPMPFVDIWKEVADKITEVQLFYSDTDLLADYLKEDGEIKI